MNDQQKPERCGRFPFTSMKKIIFLSLLITSVNLFAQKSKPMHFSVVQSVSTDGLASRNNNYIFSFNLFSGSINDLTGIEIGGLYNQNNGMTAGFQVAGFMNLTKGSVKGIQLAGLTNFSASVSGVQLAGLLNRSTGLTGLQIGGIVNTATHVKGVQLSGILNSAKTLNGLQIGLINIIDSDAAGGAVGLVTIVRKNGYREIEVALSDYQNIAVSFKAGVQQLYTILAVGYNFMNEPLYSTSFGFGSVLSISRNWKLKPELVASSYINEPFKPSKSMNVFHFKAGIMRKVNRFGITVMPAVYYAKTNKNDQSGRLEISNWKPFYVKGNRQFGFGMGIGFSLINKKQ